MNVLIAGGFWSIAKFMVLLCCTVILIIKSLYFYIKTCKKWKKMTQIFYIMMVGSFLLSLNRFMWCGWFNQKLLGCRIPFYANI